LLPTPHGSPTEQQELLTNQERWNKRKRIGSNQQGTGKGVGTKKISSISNVHLTYPFPLHKTMFLYPGYSGPRQPSLWMSKLVAWPGPAWARARPCSFETCQARHGNLWVVLGLPGVSTLRPKHGPMGTRAGRVVPLAWTAH
jgi:hypothetical protein